MKRKCLVMETDKNSLQSAKEVARAWYDVLDASAPDEAKRLLQKHGDVSVFVTHHGENGYDCINLLEEVRSSYPDILRVVMTSYQDFARIVHGLHSGTIQKVVQKPINPLELQCAIIPFQHHQRNSTHAVPDRLAG